MKTLATKKNCTKISFDFHGVINKHPTFFKNLSTEFMCRGFEIYIVSGGPFNDIKEYLLIHEIPYSAIWCIFDYYEQKDKITVFADGSFHMDDKLWNEAKAVYCRKQNICLHIDDSTIYKKYFTTPYCLYDTETQTGYIGNYLINFSSPAEETATDILSVLSSLNSAAEVSHR
ncbi:MAG: hypothetical protein IJ778_04510 [Alphaproteobacteria bacterium]|nr:hypothetical protein [Alphaproteobacteria bacterium]